MISFSNAVSFAFNRRSFIIGTGILFCVLLLMIGMGFTLYKLGPQYANYLQSILKNEDIQIKIFAFLYTIKLLGFSLFFSYLFIKAKREVYNLSSHFSTEFFYRVLACVFAFQLITDGLMYLIKPLYAEWIFSRIFLLLQNPSGWGVICLIGGILGTGLFVGYVLSAIYMAYLMNFNFSRFFMKLRYTFSSPITFFKMIGLFLLFILLSILPIIGLYLVLGTFDARTFVMTFASCIMGTTASIGLLFYTLLIGTPIALFCIYTSGGRILGIFLTVVYFTLYGVLRLMGVPAFPISALLYGYVFFFIINLLYIIFVVAYPSFWIHLMAQGALEVNQKFDPSIGVSEEEKGLNNDTVQSAQQGITDYSLAPTERNMTAVLPDNLITEDKTNPMVKIGIILLIVLGIAFGIVFYQKSHQPEIEELPYKNSGIKVKYLNGEALEFVQKYYPSNQKKLVVYLDDLPNSQSSIERNFLNVITSAKNSNQWQEYYDFVPLFTPSGRATREEAAKLVAQWNKFTNDICRYVCIVDTQEKWVFEVKRPDLLEVSLEEFKK